MGRGYSGNHPRFSKRMDERYDAKEAYNKDLTASARLHYLENDRHDHESPAEKHCSPMHRHTDAHMRRQAKRIARRTQGDEQDIYYEMKSKKMNDERSKGKMNKKDFVNTSVMGFAGGASMGKNEKAQEAAQEFMGRTSDITPKNLFKSSDAGRSEYAQEKLQEEMDRMIDERGGSPMNMEGKGCAKSEGGSGCVVKRGGEFVILNNKKGGIFQSGFKSKAAAEKSLAGYHANK